MINVFYMWEGLLMDQNISTVIECQRMLNAIRLRGGKQCSIETLKDILGISRVTADKHYNKLSENLIQKDKEKNMLIINNVGYFLGISIGSSHIRASLIDLSFEAVDAKELYYYFNSKLAALDIYRTKDTDTNVIIEYQDCLSYNTPRCSDMDNDSNKQLVILKFIIRTLVETFSDDDKYPIWGIGFGVSGPVDYDEKVWCSAPRITDILNITIEDLIGFKTAELLHNKGVFLSLENNAKTAMISEYQYLMENKKAIAGKGVALFYYGTGLGFSVVINNRLVRGSHNMCGELGHIPFAVLSKTNHDVSLSYEIDRGYSIEEIFKGFGDDQQTQKTERFIEYLPYLLQMVNCMLGIDSFIIVGHNLEENKKIVPAVMDQRVLFTVKSTQRYCVAETGRNSIATAAIGAAIEAYFTMCNYDGDDDYVNLSDVIEWPPIA